MIVCVSSIIWCKNLHVNALGVGQVDECCGDHQNQGTGVESQDTAACGLPLWRRLNG